MTGDFGTIDSNLAAGGLTLNDNDLTNLRTAGKWARFLAILGLVSLGLIILGLLFGGATMVALLAGGGVGAEAGAGAFIMVFYGLFVLFAAYLYWQLYQFGAKAVQAVDTGNQLAMSESLQAQGKLYKIMGILAAIYLGFMALGLVAMIAGGAAAML